MINGEATNTNFIVFGSTRSGLVPTIYHTWDEQANHYTTDAVRKQVKQSNFIHIHKVTLIQIVLQIVLGHPIWKLCSLTSSSVYGSEMKCHSLRNNSWKPYCVVKFNMGWSIKFTYILPTHVKTHNTIWLPWISSILTCIIVQIRYIRSIPWWERRLFIFMFAGNVAHNVCCQIRADDNSSTYAFTTGTSVLLIEHQ